MNDKYVVFELIDHRLVKLNLDDDSDWGDIRIEPSSRIGGERILIGNDVDGWKPCVRFFELVEDSNDPSNENNDYIDKKWTTFVEVTKDDVIEWVVMREIKFCEGMTKEDLANVLEEYGIDINKVYIPKDWICE